MDSGSDDSGDQSYVPGKPDSVKKKVVSKKGKGKKISKAKAAKALNKTPVKSACLNCRKSKVGMSHHFCSSKTQSGSSSWTLALCLIDCLFSGCLR